MQEMKRFGTWT